MLAFFRRRKLDPAAIQSSHESIPPVDNHEQQQDASLNDTLQAVDRKIHPDLNALADELEPIPRQPSPQKAPPISYTTEYHERRSSSIEIQPLSVPRKKAEGRSQDIVNPTTSALDETSSGIFAEWPTFGRKASEGTMSSAQAFSTPIRKKESWRRQRSSSWSTTRSREAAQSQDSSLHPYIHIPASHSRSSQSLSGNNIVPSPDIFGLRRRSSTGTRASSYFPKAETPPPLPPLDHPAFRLSSIPFGRKSEVLDNCPTTQQHEEKENVKGLRVSHSSPDISTQARTQMGSTGWRNSHPSRRRARTIVDGDVRRHSLPPSPANVSRNHSVHSKRSRNGSSLLSRRSSAELSSKIVSSIGRSGDHEKSWEVQVTKEVLRMSLASTSFSSGSTTSERFGPEDRSSAKYGNMSVDARGHNVGSISLQLSPVFVLSPIPIFLPFSLSFSPYSLPSPSYDSSSHLGGPSRRSVLHSFCKIPTQTIYRIPIPLPPARTINTLHRHSQSLLGLNADAPYLIS
ncbi:hypothetical protein BDQ17DRAFT_1353342 [Cyathus striatus]|nr:hypothetical protein BDQ17DRAFT_1353342 [Cyathus striatus]